MCQLLTLGPRFLESLHLEVEEQFASGSLGHLSENDVRTTCSSIVVRMPSLAKFLASIPSDILTHEFCDLAFCSYAWNDPCGRVTKLDLPWSVCLCCHDLAARLAEFALGSVVDGEGYDASLEERKSALIKRRSAGDWAYAISAADFVRFIACCRLGAEALYLMDMFYPADDSMLVVLKLDLWRRVALKWQLCQDGCNWIEEQTVRFLQDAEASLGRFADEPSQERLSQLLRVSKPSDSRTGMENGCCIFQA